MLTSQHQERLATEILEAEASENLLKFNKTLGRYPDPVTEDVSGLPVLPSTPTGPTLLSNAPSSKIAVQEHSTSHEYLLAMLGWLV